MGFSYMKSKLLLVSPYSTSCLNKIVSHSHQYLVENTFSPMNASSYIHGLKHISSPLLFGCGRKFYSSNPYPLHVFTHSALQGYKLKKNSWWQWLKNRKYRFVELFIMFNILYTSFEMVPYSNRIHMVTSYDKLERFVGWLHWKKMEEEYQRNILPPSHPQSVRVQSILRNIVQGMNNGLGLEKDCNVSVYGSEGTLLVSKVDQECQKRPKKSFIKFGTRHLEGLNWEVMVVNSYKTNAEHLHKGKIVIYTGMLEFCNSDAELAYVLGHEVGHGVARHASEFVLRAFWMTALMWPFNRLLIGPLLQPVYMYFKRRREFEADHIGLMLMASAGYDPQVAPKHEERVGDSDTDWLSTHPSSEKRAGLLKENKVMGEALAIYKEVRSGQRVKCFV